MEAFQRIIDRLLTIDSREGFEGLLAEIGPQESKDETEGYRDPNWEEGRDWESEEDNDESFIQTSPITALAQQQKSETFDEEIDRLYDELLVAVNLLVKKEEFIGTTNREDDQIYFYAQTEREYIVK